MPDRNKQSLIEIRGDGMTLSELIEKLNSLDVKGDDPDVYIRFGLRQDHVWDVEYYPETDDEWSAVVIS